MHALRMVDRGILKGERKDKQKNREDMNLCVCMRMYVHTKTCRQTYRQVDRAGGTKQTNEGGTVGEGKV